MNLAIWAAVSTRKQAEEDKASIPTQIEKGMQYIESHHHTLTAQYIVPGESRTHYISLAHAEKAIPQLKQLLDDASHGKFDLLWVYDLNRFRNLMLQVFEALAGYGVQIYNHDSPEEPVPPHQYTPEVINHRRLTVKLHDIISGQETNTLQKHFREKMPKRVSEKRLHPGLGLPPYGYRKPPGKELDRNAILEINPEQAAILNQIKDWFLNEGLSLTAITQRLNAANIPSPRGKRWWFSIVRYLLANPFYAGTVRYGVTKRNRDRRLVTVHRSKGTEITEAVGIHKPLWDSATHQRILRELERRANAQPGFSTRAFTRLLFCQCGAVLWAQTTPAGQYWRCSTLKRGHTYLNNNKALEIVIPEIIKAIQEFQLKPAEKSKPTLPDPIPNLKAQERRLLDLYQDGTIDKATLNERIADIKTRLTLAQNERATQAQSRARRLALQQDITTAQQTLATLPTYIRQAPATRVNATLHKLFKKITISKDLEKIDVEFRE